MRTALIILFISFSFCAFGQKVHYWNDSLFVNSFYVNSQTSKATLDSLLNDKSKTKRSRYNHKINPVTGKKVFQTTDYYYDLGLFFRKYDDDPTKLSVGIKLYRDTDKQKDRNDELSELFRGELYIAGNYINDKRTLEQLQQLTNCSVTTNHASIGSISTLIGGDIIYLQNIIRLSFDSKTDELRSVLIHHNFKDR